MSKKNGTSDYRTLRIATDILRRALKLQADWTAFDPYGAVVYQLKALADNAWGLREKVLAGLEDLDFTEAPLPVARAVGFGKAGYALFKEEVKGIEGALRRIMGGKYALELSEYERCIRSNLRELKADGGF